MLLQAKLGSNLVLIPAFWTVVNLLVLIPACTTITPNMSIRRLRRRFRSFECPLSIG